MICWCGMEIIFFIQISHMSVLSQKLQEAARLFQTHNFKQSLDAYQDCLTFCRKTDQCDSVIYNISSAKASLEYILGDYESALGTLNGVLRQDPYHFLSLLKRSQVYKKKNKLKRALKDLETIYVFSPDNLQISAFKTEIEHLLLKQQKQHDITSDSEEEEEDDEEAQLNFSKLKQIDRKSIDNSSMKQRKSRVTILGDSTFEYKIDEEPQQSTPVEGYSDKALRTYKEIELDDDDEEVDSMPIIQIRGTKQNKSILKNKGTSIFIQADDAASRRSRYLGRESKLLALIKNIDGKIIPSAEHEHSSNPAIKEVEFRKSIRQQPQHFLPIPIDNISSASSKQRKSCLKRPSFDIPEIKVKNQPLRRSKFQSIDATKIDGHLLLNPRRKSIQNNSSLAVSQGQYDHVKPQSDSDNDGSEHNIFGSKQFVLSQDMKQKLGLTEDLSLSLPVSQYPGKKSILKRNSSLAPTILHKKQSILVKGPPTLKSKKSVMFNCTL